MLNNILLCFIFKVFDFRFNDETLGSNNITYYIIFDHNNFKENTIENKSSLDNHIIYHIRGEKP